MSTSAWRPMTDTEPPRDAEAIFATPDREVGYRVRAGYRVAGWLVLGVGLAFEAETFPGPVYWQPLPEPPSPPSPASTADLYEPPVPTGEVALDGLHDPSSIAADFAARVAAGISDLRVHDRALTPAEVAADFESAETCTRPPAGWYCTREPGHDGPCAALPVDEPKQPWRAGYPPMPSAPDGRMLEFDIKPIIDSIDREHAAREVVLGTMVTALKAELSQPHCYGLDVTPPEDA